MLNFKNKRVNNVIQLKPVGADTNSPAPLEIVLYHNGLPYPIGKWGQEMAEMRTCRNGDTQQHRNGRNGGNGYRHNY